MMMITVLRAIMTNYFHSSLNLKRSYNIILYVPRIWRHGMLWCKTEWRSHHPPCWRRHIFWWRHHKRPSSQNL